MLDVETKELQNNMDTILLFLQAPHGIVVVGRIVDQIPHPVTTHSLGDSVQQFIRSLTVLFSSEPFRVDDIQPEGGLSGGGQCKASVKSEADWTRGRTDLGPHVERRW